MEEKLELYAVKDVVVGKYQNPILMHNDNEAIRSLKEAGLKTDGMIYQHAEDIQLWHLGTYYPDTGEIISNVYIIGNVIDYVKKVDNNV